MRKSILFSAAATICLAPLASHAEVEAWQLCGFSEDNVFLPVQSTTEEGPIDVKANNAQLINNGTSVFSGDVSITQNGQELTAQRATYNRNTGDVTAQGDVKLRDSEAVLTSEQAEWSVSNDAGRMIGATYRLRQNHARGKASSLFRKGTELTRLNNASYTTCSEGDDSWILQSDKVSLDHAAGVGSARDVTVKLAGIPVFYTPYISFPLNDDRKSGFLVPSVGISDETGFDLTTPYYWNIAPNQDATLSPRLMSERGLMLNAEYRYLLDNFDGVLDAGYLTSDNQKNSGTDINPHYDERRAHFTMKSDARFLNNWHARVDYNYVSDDRYLEDFSPNLSLASTTHLNRLLDLGYAGQNWRFTGKLQGYQTLTDVTAPYQKLPQLSLNGVLPDQALGLTFAMNTEYVDFKHNDQVSGQRIDLKPSVSLPLSNAYSFLTPRLALHHTRYSLDDNASDFSNNSPSRSLPVASVDGGLFFEREINLGQTNYIQTFEPRAFYLYIPEKNQSDIPIFDTGLRTFSMDQMFSYDRFSGTDRVGDANQLTLAVTTRIIDAQTGKENLRVSLGQIQYFTDREVLLNDTDSVETDSTSDMVAEVVAAIADEWTLRSEIQWDTASSTSNMSSVQLRYQGQNGSIVNLGHRYRREGVYANAVGLEQVDISTQFPINNQWSVVGRWYRSLKESKTLETLAGLQYESCCWATRLVLRDYVNDISAQESNLALFFQIELKGLGNFGQNTDALLERSRLGFGA